MKDDIAKLIVLAVIVNELSIRAFQMFDFEPNDVNIDNIAVKTPWGSTITHSSDIKSLGDAMKELDNIMSQILPKVSSEEIVMIEQYKIHAKDREIEALKAKIALLTDKPNSPYC